MSIDTLAVDRLAGSRGERDEVRSAAVAASFGRPGSPLGANWPVVGASEEEGLLSLMAELSLRVVRAAPEFRGGDDEHVEVNQGSP